MTRNRIPDPKPWLSQLKADKLKATPISSRVELGPKATARLLRAIANLPPEKR